MRKCRAIFKHEPTCAPWPLESSARGSMTLPADVTQAASRRLGFAGFAYAFAFTGAFFGKALFDYVRTGILPPYILTGRSLIALVAILMGIMIFIGSRTKICSARRLLHIGLGFEVLGALGISLTTFWGIFPTESLPTAEAARQFVDIGIMDRCHVVGIPWTCVWIVMFPFLTIVKPIKATVAAYLAASTDLIVILLGQRVGVTSPHVPFTFLFSYFLFSTYLCATLAILMSQGIYRIGMHLVQAREFGSYQLTALLGRGGMGEVWLAKHKMLARPAAIKLIRPEVLGADEETRAAMIRRFKREAQATAGLRSSHTISVYDFGTTSDGSFYYVMELLDGMDLKTAVQRFGPMSAARTVRILLQVCHSLIDAHENGLIHRDIKPANIYISRLGPDCDYIKVLDFGLVKSQERSPSDVSQVTQIGSAIGSPGFMAPEMALGKKEIDARADLYSLGCVAYWLLTGQLVFQGDSSIETLVQQVQAQPVPPSHRTEIEIPSALEEIILACLAKDPAERPQSARELKRALDTCELPGVWTEEMAAEWWELHVPPFDPEKLEAAGETGEGAHQTIAPAYSR